MKNKRIGTEFQWRKSDTGTLRSAIRFLISHAKETGYSSSLAAPLEGGHVLKIDGFQIRYTRIWRLSPLPWGWVGKLDIECEEII